MVSLLEERERKLERERDRWGLLLKLQDFKKRGKVLAGLAISDNETAWVSSGVNGGGRLLDVWSVHGNYFNEESGHHYVGTHNFHNFTTRRKAKDPFAYWFIISFEANSTVVVEGMEIVKCEIVGQSFMLR
ncbi:hypothetical protein PIB30_048202 [Stylosanthes scabra]|uniref:Uncharacterized protein n=1 Tax=Stylosanthes scabra TaxID=79078 RepID=A0ABU6RHN9_9FABA|nr:hypothetical protein [Stylosanthes scabra]